MRELGKNMKEYFDINTIHARGILSFIEDHNET